MLFNNNAILAILDKKIHLGHDDFTSEYRSVDVE